MLQPVYDIAAPDISSDQWMHCRLVLEMHGQHVQYAVLQENKLLCWKYYQIPAADLAEAVLHAGAILESDEVLRNLTKEQTVVFNYPESCLIPAQLSGMESTKNMLVLMHGDINKGNVVTEKIAALNLYNVFRLPGGLEEVLKKKFPNAHLRHHTSVWLESLPAPETLPGRADIIFSEKDFVLHVFAGGKLQLVQSYFYQTPEDVLYHLLNIFRQLGLHQEQSTVCVSGIIKPDSLVYTGLLTCFALLRTDDIPANFDVPANFQSVPAHFFSPLLKMSRCV